MDYKQQLEAYEVELKRLRSSLKKEYLSLVSDWRYDYEWSTRKEIGKIKNKARFEGVKAEYRIIDKEYWKTVGQVIGDLSYGQVFDIYGRYQALTLFCKQLSHARISNRDLVKRAKEMKSLLKGGLNALYHSHNYLKLVHAKQEAKRLQEAGYRYQVYIAPNSSLHISLLPPPGPIVTMGLR